MAVIKSGATSDNLTIDPTSKAARVTPYDTRGNSMAKAATYRAATATTYTTAANNTTPVFVFYGSPNQYRIKNRLFVIREGIIVDYGSDTKIYYVHQFQNLYFALTGEELTINEN